MAFIESAGMNVFRSPVQNNQGGITNARSGCCCVSRIVRQIWCEQSGGVDENIAVNFHRLVATGVHSDVALSLSSTGEHLRTHLIVGQSHKQGACSDRTGYCVAEQKLARYGTVRLCRVCVCVCVCVYTGHTYTHKPTREINPHPPHSAPLGC